MILAMIGAVWGIINFFLQFFQVGEGILLLISILSNFQDYLPSIITWIGYVYYFIPPSVLLPLLSLSLAITGWRISTAIINLVWW